MARYFLDSSALVKRYHQEVGSAKLGSLFQASGSTFFISRLALVEVESSFARLVREKTLAIPDFALLVSRLDQDVVGSVLTVAAVSSRRLEGAASILRTVGLTASIRTLDAIHLATAQALHGRSGLAAFVAADKKLLAAATACGLPTLDVS
jgi:uncharacterized protein